MNSSHLFSLSIPASVLYALYLFRLLHFAVGILSIDFTLLAQEGSRKVCYAENCSDSVEHALHNCLTRLTLT
jgi:hypothetical protein